MGAQGGGGVGTIALTLVGGAIGGLVGGPAGAIYGAGVGATAGSALDSYVLNPLLFPRPDILGRRLGEVPINGFAEGNPVPYVLGRDLELTAQLLWADGIDEVRRKQSVGGKGGSQQKAVNFLYFTNLAIGICENPVARFLRLEGNGKLIAYYLDAETIGASGGFNFIERQFGNKQNRQLRRLMTLRSHPDIGSPHSTVLNRVQSGETVTISGATDSANNGSFEVWDSGIIGNNEGSYLRVFNPNAVKNLSHQPAVDVIRTSTEGIYRQPRMIDSFRFRNSSPTASPDPLWDSKSFGGIGYRGITNAVLERLALEPFGNQLPTLQVRLEEDPNRTVKEGIEILLERGGFSTAEYDTSKIADTPLHGYVVPGQQTTEQALAPLMIAHDLLAREQNGVLHIFTRGSELPIEISENDLTARSEGEAPRPKVNIDDIAESELPTEITLSYLQAFGNHFFEKATVTHRKFDKIFTRPQTLDLPLALGNPQAEKIATRLLWQPSRNRQTIRFNLPPRYLDIVENSTLTVPADGEVYEVLVTSVSRGANSLLEIEGIIEDSHDGIPVDDDGVISAPPDFPLPSPIVLEVLDIPPLQDSHADRPGYYVVGRNRSAQEPFFGFSVFERSGGGEYEQIEQIDKEAVMGHTIFTEVEPFYDETIESENATIQSGDWIAFSNGLGGTELRVSDSSTATVRFDFTNMVAGLYEIWITHTDKPTGRDVLIAEVFDEDEGQNLSNFYDQRLSYAELEADPYSTTEQAGGKVWITETRGDTGEPRLYALGNTGSASVEVRCASTSAECAIDAVRLVNRRAFSLDATQFRYWDRGSTVRVELDNGTLESRTEMEVYEGRNHCVIGNEVIAFRDATLVDENTYDLSMLLRGLRGTEGEMSQHVPGERFVLLDITAMTFREVNDEQISKTVELKAVPPGAVLDDVEAQSFSLLANNLKSFAPTNLVAETFGTALHFTWTRRSRSRARLLSSGRGQIGDVDNTAGPRLFDSERFNRQIASGDIIETPLYIIEVYTDGGERKRAVLVFVEQYTYAQTTWSGIDGFISGDKIQFTVYQLTRGLPQKGRGHAKTIEATIP